VATVDGGKIMAREKNQTATSHVILAQADVSASEPT